MKIIHISDTHGFHESIDYFLEKMIEEHQPDVLVHSGDFMRYSKKHQDLEDILQWMQGMDVPHKILVPGNHDVWCEQLEHDNELRQSTIPSDIHLLINEELVIDGVKFWGSPYTPEFMSWGFQLNEREAEELWSTIPDDTNILITHGPAQHVLDDKHAENLWGVTVCEDNRKIIEKEFALGCKYLTQRIQGLKQLKGHLFGHIHESYGRNESHGYIALNSSILNGDYEVKNRPQIIEV